MQPNLNLYIGAACLSKSGQRSIVTSAPAGLLDSFMSAFVSTLGDYYKDFPGTDTATPPEVMAWFKSLYRPGASDTVVDALEAFLGRASGIEVPFNLVQRMYEVSTATKVKVIQDRIQSGEDMSLVDALTDLVDQRPTPAAMLPASNDIADVLKAAVQLPGLSFRLGCLNAGVRPLRGGDFVIVAAGVDCGKTSFCASEVTHMLPQLDILFPGENRAILWLNNEGAEDAIVQRTFQSALGMTTDGLVGLADSGTLHSEYAKAVGGRADALRIFACQGRDTGELETLFKQYRPALVVFDMLDNVKYRGTFTVSGDQRTDQVKEALYQWARAQAVKHDFVAVATSQLSHEGCNQEYPGMDFLKDSRIAKQGAADVIIIVGTKRDAGFEAVRYISTPKNKRKRVGVPKYVRAAAHFDEDVGRFYDQADSWK